MNFVSGIRFFLILLVSCFYSVASLAQEMHGFVHSNYAGITGSLINPTAILNSKLFLDIQPLGLHINVDNNYIYLSKAEYKFSRFLTPGAKFPEHGEDNRVYYDQFTTKLKDAFGEVRVFGPSAMFSLKDKAFGFATSFRSVVSGDNIPYEIAKFGIEGLNYKPLHNINFIDNHSFRAASLGFVEIAGTYSTVIFKHNRDHWTAGATVKGLFASAGGYTYVSNIDYLVPNRDTLIVNNINGEMGLSLPVDFNNNDVLIPGQLFRGSGLAMDIGITYQKKVLGYSNKGYSMPCEYPYEPYRYKIGFSLLDFGSIHFRKDARLLELVNQDTYWPDISRYEFNSLDNLFKTVSYHFSGDSTQLITAQDFRIWMPTAVSVQADVRINKEFYINATAVQPLIMSHAQVVRPSQVSLTPRWETDHLEFALPFILYNYKYPRLGFSARFHKLVIGTDKLGGFFGMSDFYGMDFYIMLKFSFLKGECRNFDRKFGCGNLEYKQKY